MSGVPDTFRQSLTEALEHQQRSCAELGSPIYARIIGAMLEDHGRQGLTSGLLARGGDRPLHDASVLRLLSGMHRLVLAGRASDLARHYPSAGGRPGPTLERDAMAVIFAHLATLTDEMTLPVQTNEPGRSIAAMTVLRHPWISTASSVAWREIGASAGLNLNFPRYAYEVDDGVVGPLESPLRFRREWSAPPGPAGLPTPEILDVRGCDPHPIDPISREGRRHLESYVWPDDGMRRERLRAALTVASRHPPAVDRASAPDWIVRQSTAPGATLVFFHSIVWQYLDGPTQAAVRSHMESAGSRTREAALVWARMEPAGPTADLRITLWRRGVRQDTIVGTIGYHGQGLSPTNPV